ncbi:hypothetical protein E2C01_022480 [Portunus trituberculatus]|uniref:Uncharacterized protein n=1 Tax=Portunus trituberculatus TaxID=210409 RepID=A0A5B7E7D5_PORTR|nr:hypothetical protein [Portunus trituberculatus]
MLFLRQWLPWFLPVVLTGSAETRLWVSVGCSCIRCTRLKSMSFGMLPRRHPVYGWSVWLDY